MLLLLLLMMMVLLLLLPSPSPLLLSSVLMFRNNFTHNSRQSASQPRRRCDHFRRQPPTLPPTSRQRRRRRFAERRLNRRRAARIVPRVFAPSQVKRKFLSVKLKRFKTWKMISASLPVSASPLRLSLPLSLSLSLPLYLSHPLSLNLSHRFAHPRDEREKQKKNFEIRFFSSSVSCSPVQECFPGLRVIRLHSHFMVKHQRESWLKSNDKIFEFLKTFLKIENFFKKTSVCTGEARSSIKSYKWLHELDKKNNNSEVNLRLKPRLTNDLQRPLSFQIRTCKLLIYYNYSFKLKKINFMSKVYRIIIYKIS